MAAAVLIGYVKTDICMPLINASLSCRCCPLRLQRLQISSQTVPKHTLFQPMCSYSLLNCHIVIRFFPQIIVEFSQLLKHVIRV